MASLRGIVGRLRGDRLDEIAREVAELREMALARNHSALHESQVLGHALGVLNHSVVAIKDSVDRLAETAEAQRAVLLELNHDVRSGAAEALPLFLGYAERLRLDTDTAIGAAQVIERQLARLEAVTDPPAAPEPT